jgi:hypothetical protein
MKKEKEKEYYINQHIICVKSDKTYSLTKDKAYKIINFINISGINYYKFYNDNNDEIYVKFNTKLFLDVEESLNIIRLQKLKLII